MLRSGGSADDRTPEPSGDLALRRTYIVALAAVALFFAGSMALLAWLTEPAPEAGPSAVERPVAVEPPGSAPVIPRPPPSVPDGPVPPVEPPPVRVAPETGNRLAEGARRVGLEANLPRLQERLVQRCGSLRFRVARDPKDPAAGLEGDALLFLDLQTSGGEARVTGTTVQSNGIIRPALVSCAQWALRGAVLPAIGEPDRTLTVPVVLGMAPGAP